jgi:hypothetical protein
MLRGVLKQPALGGIPAPSHPRQDAARKAHFERLHHCRRVLLLRFAEEQMNVLGHDHVAHDYKLITSAHLLQHGQKQVAPRGRAQQGLPAITTASDEMQVPGAIKTLEVAPHRRRLSERECERSDSAHRAVVTKTLSATGTGGPLLKKREKWRTLSYYGSRLGEVAHPPEQYRSHGARLRVPEQCRKWSREHRSKQQFRGMRRQRRVLGQRRCH